MKLALLAVLAALAVQCDAQFGSEVAELLVINFSPAYSPAFLLRSMRM